MEIVFIKELPIEDANLALLELRHAQELYDLIASCRPHLGRFLPWVGSTFGVGDSRGFIKGGLEQYAANNGFHCGIWYKRELAGVIGLHYLDFNNRKTSLGYWLGEAFQAKGLMTASARALTDYCFNELALNRVEIRVAVENIKSRAVPERLGFSQEGIIRDAEWLGDRFVDHVVYGMLKRNWT